MDTLQFLIADDHPVVRRAIRSLLESHPGWSICGEASNGREAVEQTGRLGPDVILMDLSMPGINGLQAAREIVENDRHAQVLMLTMHESADLEAEVLRSGAKGIVDKAAADATLVPAIESLLGNIIRLAGSVVGSARHIAALFHSTAERYRVLAPFIAEGLSRGERAIHIIDPPDRDAHIESLRQEGVDVAAAEADGRAQLVTWKEAYLHDDHFDQNDMLELVQQMFSDGASKGFPLTRLIAHMEWALSDRPGVGDLIAYESRLNDVLPNLDNVTICAYDLTKFGADTIVDVIRAHPAVLIGDTLRKNPFYTHVPH